MIADAMQVRPPNQLPTQRQDHTSGGGGNAGLEAGHASSGGGDAGPEAGHLASRYDPAGPAQGRLGRQPSLQKSSRFELGPILSRLHLDGDLRLPTWFLHHSWLERTLVHLLHLLLEQLLHLQQPRTLSHLIYLWLEQLLHRSRLEQHLTQLSPLLQLPCCPTRLLRHFPTVRIHRWGWRQRC